MPLFKNQNNNSDNYNNILVGTNIYNNIGTILEKKLSYKPFLAIITDNNVASLYLKPIEESLSTSGFTFIKIIIPVGESSKSFCQVQDIINKLSQHKIKRNDFIIALGGGVVGDIAGFVASIYMRGIGFINIPTTLLAQIDASIGGKTAINNSFGKNLIGSFYNAYLIIIDTQFLRSLNERDFISGYAEILKYGLINDDKFFRFCEEQVDNIFLHKSALNYIIEQCIFKKIEIVKQDKFDQNQRALLNLGHSFGHALEHYCAYNTELLIHGEAVAIGLVLAFQFSAYLGLCSNDCAIRLTKHLEKVGLPTTINIKIFNQLKPNSLLEAMSFDKKNINNMFNLILAKGIGKAFIAKEIPRETLFKFFTKILDKEN